MLGALVPVPTSEAKVNDVDVVTAKHISLPQLHYVFHRHSEVKKKIIKLQIVENVAKGVDFLEDVHQLDAQGVDALVRHLPMQLHEYIVESEAAARHHDVGVERGAVVGEDECVFSIHDHGLVHFLSVNHYKLARGSHLRNAPFGALLTPLHLPHRLHGLDFVLKLATEGLNFDNKRHAAGLMQIHNLVHLAILATIQILSDPEPAFMQLGALHLVEDGGGTAAVLDAGAEGEVLEGD